MKDRNMTIYDIAQALNISVSTVSRALNNHPAVNKKTKVLVQKKASELGYRPNFLAQNLRNKKSNTIGIIVPEIVHHFFSHVIDGIDDIAYKAGYKVLISKSNENYHREIENTQSLISCRVDGILASISAKTKDFMHLNHIKEHGLPLVLFDRITSKINSSKVIINDFESAYQAVEYFHNNGYERIAHVGGPNHLEISKQRLNGYLAALKKLHLPVIPDYIIQGDMTKEQGHRAANNLFGLPKPPHAILGVSNPIMKGIIEEIMKIDCSLLGRIGLTGYACDPDSYPINVPIGTIVQPAFEMGQEAAKLLIKEIEYKGKKDFQYETVMLKTKLITSNPEKDKVDLF